MVKLVWTTCARKQLRNIKLYYKEIASEKVAMSIILQIQQTAQLLTTQPYLGKIEPALINEPEEFRSIIEGNYKIVYWVDKKIIRIIAVFDTRQAPDKLKSLLNL
ncbi:type II toxin-antitoxin system RelE/ParE family toxin [Parabacteroides sp.]